jgi:hypothetical protein
MLYCYGINLVVISMVTGKFAKHLRLIIAVASPVYKRLLRVEIWYADEQVKLAVCSIFQKSIGKLQTQHTEMCSNNILSLTGCC